MAEKERIKEKKEKESELKLYIDDGSELVRLLDNEYISGSEIREKFNEELEKLEKNQKKEIDLYFNYKTIVREFESRHYRFSASAASSLKDLIENLQDEPRDKENKEKIMNLPNSLRNVMKNQFAEQIASFIQSRVWETWSYLYDGKPLEKIKSELNSS